MDHFKYDREEILFGLVMMDLYAFRNNQKDPEVRKRSESPEARKARKELEAKAREQAREACREIHSNIINSENQPVDPETLKKKFLNSRL